MNYEVTFQLYQDLVICVYWICCISESHMKHLLTFKCCLGLDMPGLVRGARPLELTVSIPGKMQIVLPAGIQQAPASPFSLHLPKCQRVKWRHSEPGHRPLSNEPIRQESRYNKAGMSYSCERFVLLALNGIIMSLYMMILKFVTHSLTHTRMHESW